MIKQCIICNESFDFNNRYSNSKCCSDKCSKENKRIVNNNYFKTYRKNKKYKEAHSILGKKYKQTEKYKQWEKEYSQRADVKKRNKISQNTESYKRWKKEWLKGPIGKIIHTKCRIKRRAIKNNYIETYTEKEWNDKVEATKGICPGINGICLSKDSNVGTDKLTRDHIYPISKASRDYILTGVKRIYTINDIQPLCSKCNPSKRDKIIIRSEPKDLNTTELCNQLWYNHH